MAIPKIIHYCWFGRNPLPLSAKKCMRTWRKRNPNYQIAGWNEDNIDIAACPLYVQEAYREKMWAFVTDYVRLKVVYENGGIYLDTDVESVKSFDSLLNNRAYFGFEDREHINTGLGFGAEKGCEILRELMEQYDNIHFVTEDGTLNLMACPKLNTQVFLRHGLRLDDSEQLLDGTIRILPSDYLGGMDYETLEARISDKCVSIHRYAGSWVPKEEMRAYKKSIRSRRYAMIRKRIKRAVVPMLGKWGEKLWDKQLWPR